MSDSTLAPLLTIAILAALFAWVPFLHTCEDIIRRQPMERPGEMPNLVEEESGPQFTGEIA